MIGGGAPLHRARTRLHQTRCCACGRAHGAAALAALTATQLLLRPIPLLAASWGMVARNDLVRRRDGGDWRGFKLIVGRDLLRQ